MSLNTIARPAARLPGPLVTLVRSLTVAKVDSMVILSRKLRRGCDLGGCVEDGVVDASGRCCDPAVNAGRSLLKRDVRWSGSLPSRGCGELWRAGRRALARAGGAAVGCPRRACGCVPGQLADATAGRCRTRAGRRGSPGRARAWCGGGGA